LNETKCGKVVSESDSDLSSKVSRELLVLQATYGL